MNTPKLRSAALVVAFAVLIGSPGRAAAQAAPAPTEPSESHEALSFFQGSWTTAESTPEDEFRETCGWLPEGRRHMVCRSTWLTATGRREGLSIFSFDSSTGDYLYHGFRSGGAVLTQRGRRTPTGWIFRSERGTGPEKVRTRVTIESNSQGGFNFLSETATGDGPWKEAARFVYQRRAT